jgi:hypothetical protein
MVGRDRADGVRVQAVGSGPLTPVDWPPADFNMRCTPFVSRFIEIVRLWTSRLVIVPFLIWCPVINEAAPAETAPTTSAVTMQAAMACFMRTPPKMSSGRSDRSGTTQRCAMSAGPTVKKSVL